MKHIIIGLTIDGKTVRSLDLKLPEPLINQNEFWKQLETQFRAWAESNAPDIAEKLGFPQDMIDELFKHMP